MQWRRLGWRWARGVLISLLILLAGAALLLWALGQAPGLRTLAQLASRFSQGTLQIEGVSGSLYGPVRIQSLRFNTPERHYTAHAIVFDWSPRELWRDQRLHITQLQLHSLDVDLIKPSDTPLSLPSTLRLPFALALPDARIERLSVNNHGQLFAFNQVRLSLDNPATAYHARLSAYTPWGAAEVSGELASDAPFTLNGKLQLTQNDGLRSYTLDAAARGTLARIGLSVSGTSGAASAEGSGLITPFAPVVLPQIRLNVQRLDPRRLASGLPEADLDLAVNLQARSASVFQGSIAAHNRLPGALDAGRIPLRAVQMQVAGGLSQSTLRDIQLDLGSAGQFSGSGSVAGGLLRLKLATTNLNLHGVLDQLRPTRLQGQIKLDADQAAQTLVADLAQAHYRIQLDARREGELVSVRSARLAAAGSELKLNGQLTLNAQRVFKAQGQLTRFDPSRFGAYPAATLNAQFSAQGQLAPHMQAALRLTIADSRYRGQVLSGNAVLNLAQQRVWDSTLKLRLGSNLLDAKGAFGKPGDSLSWRVDAPNLAAFWTGLAGRVNGYGTLSGSVAQPAGSFHLTASALDWRGQQHVDELIATGQLAPGLNGTVQMSARATGYRSATLQLDSAALDAHGTRAAHTLSVAARGAQLDARAALSGGWHPEQGWRGQLLRMDNSGRYPVKLNAPAGLAFGRGQFSLTNADLSLARGTVQIQKLAWSGGRITSQGSMSGLDSAYLIQLAQLKPGINSSLILGGKWQVDMANQVNGNVEIWRERGDVSVPTAPPTALGIDFLRLTLKAVANRVQGDFNLTGSTLGSVSARVDTVLAQQNGQWGLSGNAPIAMSAQATMPSLAWMSALVGGAVSLDGAVQSGVGITGTVNAPVLSGQIIAQGLRLDYPQQGVQLKDGSLSASFSQDTLTLDSLLLHGGKGTLSATGNAVFKNAQPTLQLKFIANQLTLMQRPDRQLSVSGQGEIVGAQRVLRGSAQLKVDRGMITLPKDDAPTLSSDVVVLGRQTGTADKATAYALDFDLDLDLGEQFYLKGRGVDAQLGGTVQVRSRDGRLPTANGTIQVTKGTYSAYGQRLAITRGILNFIGPLDNPGLDILAVRKNASDTGFAGASSSDTVEAGVTITGTARAPQVKLVSTPEVPDSEKLSWLVLGHGTANASANEFSALQTAAGVLLGMGDSVSLQAKIAEATGLSEINLSGGGTLESSILVLGKRLSKDVYLSYEQGLAGTTSLVKITYELSRRVSLRLQTGSQSALDIFYTFRFR